jgi:hypothetical protein
MKPSVGFLLFDETETLPFMNAGDHGGGRCRDMCSSLYCWLALLVRRRLMTGPVDEVVQRAIVSFATMAGACRRSFASTSWFSPVDL